MKVKYIIGVAVILLFVVWGASAFLKTTVQYVTIAEARQSDKPVQVLGNIDFNDYRYDVDKRRLEFSIFDAEASNPEAAEKMRVVYYGVVPGNFEQATQVVVKGKPGADGFEADKLLVKCPSKYQGMEEDSMESAGTTGS